MTASPQPDDLAALRARLDAQELAFAAFRARVEARERRRHLPRRALPLLLAALLVAIVPLGTLAANPFGDLNPGSPHNGNIDAIFNVGITNGCEPGARYCPNGLVTREEMASFLARTAGLGTNTPIVNAATAVNATNATNAQNAVNAQNATNATSAANAQNATQLGGQPASAYQLANQPIANATNAQNATNAANATTAQTATNAAQLGGIAASNYVQTGDRLLPIAFATVAPAGIKLSGTANVTVTKVATGTYHATIAGENYRFDAYTTVATITGCTGACQITVGSDTGPSLTRVLAINTANSSGAPADQHFQFVVFKP